MDQITSQPTLFNPDELVTEDRAHSAIYTSDEIFELEMERIFHGSWMYLGHHSEVPNAGDYQVRQIGRQSVIMVRGEDGQVRALMNRCAHRGMAVCEAEEGNNKFFRCWYHGWVFGTDGELLDVPKENGYAESFNKADFGLTPAPWSADYRGFHFVSLADPGIDFDDYLGSAKRYIDPFLDVSPLGEIEVLAGVHRTKYYGNWKFVGMDGYHPHFTHKSVLDMWNKKGGVNLGATHRGDPFADDSGNLTRDMGNGHVMLDFFPGREEHYDTYLKGLLSKPDGQEYLQAMEKAHGKDEARRQLIWAGDPHAGIYPNMQLINIQIRIIRPISAHETEVLMFPTLLKGVPDEINATRLRHHESFYGPAGTGAPDDAELFERNQIGLQNDVNPWIFIGRGLDRQYRDDNGDLVGLVSDEVTQRGQLKAWAKLMGSS